MKEKESDARKGNFQQLAMAPPQGMLHHMSPAMQHSMMQMQFAQQHAMPFWQQGGKNPNPIPDMQYFGASAMPSSSSNQQPAFGDFNAAQCQHHQPVGLESGPGLAEASSQPTVRADKAAPFVFKLGAPKHGLLDGDIDPKAAPICGAPVTAEAAEDAAFAALKVAKAAKPRALKKPAAVVAAGGGDDDAMVVLDVHNGESSSEEEVGPAVAALKPKPAASLPVPCAAKPSLKRPACAVSVFSLKFSVPQVTKAVLKKQSWHVFGSTVYHGAKNYALARGHDKTDASEFARRTYKVAGDQWVATGGSKAKEEVSVVRMRVARVTL